MKHLHPVSSINRFLILICLLLGSARAFSQADNCDQATPLTNVSNYCSTASQYTNVGSTPSGFSAASCWTGSPMEDVWFSFVCIGTDVLISVNGSTMMRPRITIYSGTCTGGLSQVGAACSNGTAGSPDSQLYCGGLVQGTTYLIRVSTIATNEGTFQLCINNYTPPTSAAADCGGAGRLCNKNPISVSGLSGGGSNNNEVSGTCMGGFMMYETNSVWYTWTCATAGTLTFDLLPANQNDDIDFAVFQLSTTNPCGPRTLIRCTAASCLNATASTGMNLSSTDVSEAPGCAPGEDAYVQYINMTAGTSYALLINNATASSGFTLNWGGSGTFVGPDANITTGPFVACAGTPVMFNGNTSTNYSSLNWNFNNGGGSPATATGPGPISVTYNTPGSYTAILNAADANGCTSVETAIVTVNPLVTPTFAPIAAVCQNATPPTLPTTSSNGISGTWSPAVSTATAGTTTYTFTPNAGACATTTTLNVTVNPTVNIAFAVVPAFCQGSPAPAFPSQTQSPTIPGTWSPSTISNTASGTYTFTPNAGQCAVPTPITITVSSTITPTFTPHPQYCLNATPNSLPTTSLNGVSGTWSPSAVNTSTAGSTNYTFTPDAGGCAVPVTITIVVGPPPVPTFTQIAAFCQGTTAPSLPTTSNNNITGTWSPANVSNTASGTYTFTPNAGECGTSTTMNITVNEPVTPTFAQIPDFCEETAAPALPSVSTNNPAISGTWSPPNISNTASGTYTFTPNTGACATTASMTVTVLQKVDPTFNQLPAFCAGTTAPVLSGTSTNAISGSWSPANVSNSASGTYTFTPNITECANPTTMNITVNPIPTVNVSSNSPVCVGFPINLTANTVAGGTYDWSGPAAFDSNLEDPTIASATANNGGNYSLNITDANGCTGTGTTAVTVNGAVVPVLTPVGPFCAEDTDPVTLTADISGGTWTGNGVVNAVGTFIPSVAGAGTHTLTYTHTQGCGGTNSMNIVVNNAPPSGFTANVTSGCPPLTVTFTSDPGMEGALWDFGSGTPVNSVGMATHTFSSSGTYTVSLTNTLNGCSSTTTMTDYITVFPAPDASFTTNTTQLSQLNTTVHFENNSSNATTYSWDFGDGSATSAAVNPTHEYPIDPGSYVVTLTATNEGGCTDVAYLTIIVEEDQIIYVPNSFTPDGDEYNNSFQPVLSEGFDLNSYTLLLFNRWGEIVFESMDPAAGWDGTYHGKPVPQGTYTWTIRVKNKSNDKFNTYSGHLTVIR